MSNITARAKHGTDRRYRFGCRCDLCRLEKNRRMREYNQRRKDRDGVTATSYSKRLARGANPLAVSLLQLP